MTWRARTRLSSHSAADIFCFKEMQELCCSRVNICILHIRLVNPPGHPKTPPADEVRGPPAYRPHQHARRGPCAVLPVLSQASEGCEMLGDTDRVLQPHHRKARAEKEGACVGVAERLRDRIICDRWAVQCCHNHPKRKFCRATRTEYFNRIIAKHGRKKRGRAWA